MSKIPGGIYPVMITPFTADNQVDYEAVDRIVEFYAQNGCHGVFAVCQSSEMFRLTEDECVRLAERVVRAAAGRMAVVASGHTAERLGDQICGLKRMADAGVDAVVMISNRLASPEENDDALIARMNTILKAIPDATFGMYECPYPYKRMLTDRVLKAMTQSGRFTFIKDTCCSAPLIAERMRLLDGRVQLFNANCATALETFEAGADGFSGIMANYFPDLLVWMYENYRVQPERARRLSSMLSIMSLVEGCGHPAAAKYHMNRIGVPMEIFCRSIDAEERFGYLNRHAIDDLLNMEKEVREWLRA